MKTFITAETKSKLYFAWDSKKNSRAWGKQLQIYFSPETKDFQQNQRFLFLQKTATDKFLLRKHSQRFSYALENRKFIFCSGMIYFHFLFLSCFLVLNI